MVNIVNVVGAGNLGREVDLRVLSTDMESFYTEYEPEVFPGLQIRSNSTEGVCLLFTSGSFVITGVTTETKMNDLFEEICVALQELEIDIPRHIEPPEVKNLVCKGDLERELELSALTIGLGMDFTEYEPEQSPFVYYWPENEDCLITIPRNGEVVITGVQSINQAEEAFTKLKEDIVSLFEES